MKYILFFFILISSHANGAPNYISLGKVYYLKDSQNNFIIARSVQEKNTKNLANMGDAMANYDIGLILMQKENFKDAFFHFAKACDKKIAKACNNAGFIKHHNLESLKNSEREKAIFFYEKGRDLNNNFAIFNLGRYYLKDKNHILSYLYYQLALDKFKNKATKKTIEDVKNDLFKKLNTIEREYLKKYYPKFLASVASKNIKQGKIITDTFNLPPSKTEISGNNKLIKYNNPNAKNKKIVMMNWEPIKTEFIAIPAPLITEDISSQKNINLLTYRYNIPAKISISLTEKITKIPVLHNDEIIVYIHSGIKNDEDNQWSIEEFNPSATYKTNPITNTKNGWEIFNVYPNGKGIINIRFYNKKTKNNLELLLHSQ